MRRIYIEDGLSLRFPGRDEEFHQGVEIGVIAVLLSSAQGRVTLWVSSESVEQARVLSDRMGFKLTARQTRDDYTQVTFAVGRAGPELRLVHSNASAGEQRAHA